NALSVGRYNNRVIARDDVVGRQKRLQEQRKLGICNFNMCESVPGYPEKHVRGIIEKHSSLHSYFGNVIEPTNGSIAIISRISGTDLHPEPFCKTVDVTSLPQLMIDVDNQERTIANIQNFTQTVKFQTCDYPVFSTKHDQECFAGKLLDHKTKCIQKYNIIKLVTVNIENNALEYRKFQIPSTCVCAYIKKDT
ncbi:uncharacterized protein BDFB_008734, partial [Asbolus verrucosus]